MAYVAKIRVIGIATKELSTSVAWDLLPGWCLSLLQLLISKVETTYHNGLYDRTVLRAQSFIVPTIFDGAKWFDTLLAHHAAFPGNSHRLQVVASQFYGVSPWKSEFRNAEETPQKLAEYNAKDTGATHALRAPLQKWITRTNTQRVFDLDLKMSDVASHMHIAGMPVDREVNSELLATFSKNVKESRRAVEDTARDPKLREQIWHHLALAQAGKKRKLDPDDFEERYQVRLSTMKLDPDWKWKIGASKHIAALLQAMGVALYQTTEAGEISTKKDVLEALVEYPIVRDILTFRENDKLLSTFVWQIFDRFDNNGECITYGYADQNSRIHPIWNVHRISGRWASQWPVVSNVPKDKWLKLIGDMILRVVGAFELPGRNPDKAQIIPLPDGTIVRVNKDGTVSKLTRPNLRRQIKAPPGRIFVGFDFGQIEARVIALISGDPFLCKIFADPKGDPHIECARIIWPIFDSLDSDTRKQLRENVKNIEYGAMYMAQLDTLHQTMLKAGNLIKKADLAVAIDKLLRAMAGVVRWQAETIRKASMPPYEITDFVIGRRRVWPMGKVEGPEAVNYGVQTTASALMNQGMAIMFPKLAKYRDAWVIGQFHDAAVFECWEDDAERLGVDIDESFATAVERDGRQILFPIDKKIGPSWDRV
jgi:DNA polymerase I-like protein with 3'-5' exonuclease and polymerase domains